MPALQGHFHDLVGRYHGPEGDAFAIAELNPVASRFVGPDARVLEVGCGYGRNVAALARLGCRAVVGCDVDRSELMRARARVRDVPDAAGRVLLAQQEPWRLPFADGTFDFVVLWQVLEHVFAREDKARVLAECTRVLRHGGHLLIETPNQWFPFDYHDNKLPLVHWLLPRRGREWVTMKVRGKRYHPSMYLSLNGYTAMLRNSPGVAGVHKATRVYFARSYREAWRELAGTQIGLKRALFVLLAPAHAVLSLFGTSADHLLPSLRVVWRIDKARAGRTGAPATARPGSARDVTPAGVPGSRG
jgi:SAM-dependent methyltransferase